MAGNEIVDRLFDEAATYVPPGPALGEAAELTKQLETDERFHAEAFGKAWKLTDRADHEHAPQHLVAAVRAKLALRLLTLFHRRFAAAQNTAKQPARREAFQDADAIGSLYMRFVQDDWARMLRFFQPWMQTVALETSDRQPPTNAEA